MKHLLVIFLVFSIDIRVKAHVWQEPESCVTEATCSVYNRGKFHYKWELGDDGYLSLAPETIVKRIGEQKYVLVKGKVLVQSKIYIEMTSEFGSAKAISGGSFMMINDNRDTRVVNFAGDNLLVRPRGAPDALTLPIGYENWLSGVAKNGVAESGIARTVAQEQLIKIWGQFFFGELKDFRTQVEEIRPLWVDAASKSGEWHKVLIKRQLAAIAADEARRAAEQRRIEKENAELRKLFRQKNFLD